MLVIPFLVLGILYASYVLSYDQLIIPNYVRLTLEKNIEDGFYDGIIIGKIDQFDTEFFALGNVSPEYEKPINENTKFEIASISKLFTAILLADLVEKGEADLDDSIVKFLPGDLEIKKNNTKITLKQLATHTSGLPRLPINQTNSWREFYTSYNSEQTLEFLSLYSVKESGSFHFYSNYGYTLLGYLLETIYDSSLSKLIEEKILSELGMQDTVITQVDNKDENFAIGYRNGKPIENLQWRAPLGAGGYHSTANDLIKFLSVNIGLEQPTPSTFVFTHKPLHNITSNFVGQQSLQGLGWNIVRCPGTEVIWHAGATDGFRSFIGFEPSKYWGVVVLSNSETDVEHIGFSLLNNETFKMREFNLNTVSSEIIDEILGVYEFSEDHKIVISKIGKQLFAQRNNEQKLKIYPESESKFFFTDEYSYLEFKKNDKSVIDTVYFSYQFHGNEKNLRYCSDSIKLIGSKIFS